jgi:hypothetical protein
MPFKENRDSIRRVESTSSLVFMVKIRQLGLRKEFKIEESAARSTALDENAILKRIEIVYGARKVRVHCFYGQD